MATPNVYNTPLSSLEKHTALTAASINPMEKTSKGTKLIGPPLPVTRKSRDIVLPSEPHVPIVEPVKRGRGRPRKVPVTGLPPIPPTYMMPVDGGKFPANMGATITPPPMPVEISEEQDTATASPDIKSSYSIQPTEEMNRLREEIAWLKSNPGIQRPEWEGRDLFVAFPCYKTTNPVTAWCLLALALDLGQDKVRFDMELGDAMIYHARNRLAEKFLATEANWMLMIDDDIIPPVGRPGFTRSVCRLPATVQEQVLQRHVVHRLMGHKKTLVGGAYFGRQQAGQLMASCLEYSSAAKAATDMVVPCDWVGTGCLLIHRSVFDAIKQKFPDLAPSQPGQPFDYFRPIGQGIGEDISFCSRARQSGHMPHIDLGLQCYHVGYQCYYGQ